MRFGRELQDYHSRRVFLSLDRRDLLTTRENFPPCLLTMAGVNSVYFLYVSGSWIDIIETPYAGM